MRSLTNTVLDHEEGAASAYTKGKARKIATASRELTQCFYGPDMIPWPVLSEEEAAGRVDALKQKHLRLSA